VADSTGYLVEDVVWFQHRTWGNGTRIRQW
jgi:hypothetical protein